MRSLPQTRTPSRANRGVIENVKRLIRQPLFVFFAAVLLSGCSSGGSAIFLKDYMDSSSETDAMPAIRAALDDCVRKKASKLVLPGGIVRVKPAKAYEEYQYISNNDPSMKRIAFQMKGMKDFTVEGNGTELLFSGHISPFNLEGCANITIKDLTIDFTRPFVSEGVITAVGKGFFEVQFPEYYDIVFREGNLQFRDEDKEIYPYSSLLEFDKDRKEVAYHVHDYWIWTESSQAVEVGPKRYRFYREDYGDGTVGNVLAFGASSRNNPAFTLLDCDGFNLTDVKLYNCCGMGVIAQSSKDIELLRMDVEPTPGSDRVISISADATHFVNCKGYIRMIDCVFKGQKDDATNVHGWYMAVEKILSPDRLLLRWKNSGQYGVRFIKPGMTLEIVDSQIMEARDRKVVKTVDYLNSEYAEVTFTEPLPSEVKEGDVVAEDDEYPDVLISGCYIGNNRARGLLIGSRGKVIIEKNTFHSPGTAILFEGDGRYWYEQSGVRDVVIRDNVFDNCMYGSATWGSAVIAVGSGIPDREHSRYHKNILVENNVFRGFDHRIVNLYCVDGFTFKGNKIEFTDADYPANGTPEDRFIFKNCDNIKVEE